MEKLGPPIKVVDKEPRKINLIAGCQTCDWKISFPSTVLDLQKDAKIVCGEADLHQKETGHSIYTSVGELVGEVGELPKGVK
jgi:hypothetical protein